MSVQQSTTEPQGVWDPQQEFLTDLYGKAQQLYGQQPAAPFSTGMAEQIYGQGPAQVSAEGLDLTRAGVGGAGSILGQAGQAYGQALTADPSQSPYFQSAVGAAMSPMVSQFTEQVIPQLRSGALQGGTFGGSRRELAEGRAAEGLARQMGDVAAQMGQQAYGQGLQARTQALGMAPQLAGAAFMPGQEMQRAQQAQQALQMGGLQQQWAPLQYLQQAEQAGQGLQGGAIGLQWQPLQQYAGLIGGPTVLGQGGSSFGIGLPGAP